MINRMEENPNFLKHVFFSGESCFYTCGKVNKYNYHIWKNENLQQLFELERDTPKVSVCLGMHANDIIGPFVFTKCPILKTLLFLC